jgi:hypothetical protein
VANKDEPPSRRLPINRPGPQVRPPRIPTVPREAAPRPEEERVRDSRDSSPPPPLTNGRFSFIERTVNSLRNLTLTNVLVLALCALVAVPSYAAYRFLTDRDFRREFVTRARLIETPPTPCIVLETALPGAAKRVTLGVVYGIDASRGLERIAAIRSVGPLSDSDIVATCRDVIAMANTLKNAPP